MSQTFPTQLRMCLLDHGNRRRSDTSESPGPLPDRHALGVTRAGRLRAKPSDPSGPARPTSIIGWDWSGLNAELANGTIGPVVTTAVDKPGYGGPLVDTAP